MRYGWLLAMLVVLGCDKPPAGPAPAPPTSAAAALPPAPDIPADLSLDEVEALLQEAWSRHQTITLKFETTAHRYSRDAILEGLGTGTYEILCGSDPVRYRVEINTKMERRSPEQNVALEQFVRVVVDGDVQYVVQNSGGKELFSKRDVNPEYYLEPRGVLARLRAQCTLSRLADAVVDGRNAVVVQAEHPDPTYRDTSRTVCYFDPQLGLPLKLVKFDAEGREAEVFRLSDFRFDAPIDPQRFVFSPPPGVEVVDMTRAARAARAAATASSPSTVPAEPQPDPLGPLSP